MAARTGIRVVALAVALLAAGIGCGDFRSPAELKHAQILAVRLSAPELRPGEQAMLEALASDDAGALLMMNPVETTLAPDAVGRPILLPPSVPPPVRLEGDRWLVQAPDTAQVEELATAFGLLPEAPVPLPLRLTFQMGTTPLRADKTVLLLRDPGATPIPNPAVAEILVAGAPVPETGTTIAVNEAIELRVQLAPGDRPLNLAWYTSVGELSHYRNAFSTLRAPEPGEGVLLVVVRNDRGGVGWKSVKLEARR